jgi:hypothetical protein
MPKAVPYPSGPFQMRAASSALEMTATEIVHHELQKLWRLREADLIDQECFESRRNKVIDAQFGALSAPPKPAF